MQPRLPLLQQSSCLSLVSAVTVKCFHTCLWCSQQILQKTIFFLCLLFPTQHIHATHLANSEILSLGPNSNLIGSLFFSGYAYYSLCQLNTIILPDTTQTLRSNDRMCTYKPVQPLNTFHQTMDSPASLSLLLRDWGLDLLGCWTSLPS